MGLFALTSTDGHRLGTRLAVSCNFSLVRPPPSTVRHIIVVIQLAYNEWSLKTFGAKIHTVKCSFTNKLKPSSTQTHPDPLLSWIWEGQRGDKGQRDRQVWREIQGMEGYTHIAVFTPNVCHSLFAKYCRKINNKNTNATQRDRRTVERRITESVKHWTHNEFSKYCKKTVFMPSQNQNKNELLVLSVLFIETIFPQYITG